MDLVIEYMEESINWPDPDDQETFENNYSDNAMKTTNPSSRITLSQNGNQILTCKVYKEPNYILSMSNEEILELISGLDYMGNLPTVPDLEKPIEIQVSTIRRIPIEQNKKSKPNQRDNIQ